MSEPFSDEPLSEAPEAVLRRIERHVLRIQHEIDLLRVKVSQEDELKKLEDAGGKLEDLWAEAQQAVSQ